MPPKPGRHLPCFGRRTGGRMSDAVTVRPKDWVPFRCRLCGNCCRNLRGNLMPEQIDIYRLARFLRERGEVEYMEDFYTRYTYPDMLEGFFPVFLINTVDPDDSCVFLKDGRCSVYEARPRVCQLYPFTAFPGQRGKAFHFSSVWTTIPPISRMEKSWLRTGCIRTSAGKTENF